MTEKTNIPTDTTVPNISSMPVDGVASSTMEPKQPNAFVRGFRKIRTTPPKTALAVVGGVALVAAGAALGRNTAGYHVEVVDSNLELEPVLVTPEPEEEKSSSKKKTA